MKNIFSFVLMLGISVAGCTQNNNKTMDQKDFKKLTPEEERVIVHKGTEAPYTGKYTDNFEKGTYTCKRCGTELYRSNDKFHSDCGWPSFDDAINGAVNQVPDADGRRTEILCAACGAHLGHVFKGEHMTEKNTRYCVNSISMNFKPDSLEETETMQPVTDTAIFAGGCFWGVEYYLQQAPGVLSTEVGYIDGKGENPTYQQVCSHTTGYAEAVRVVFDPAKTSFEKVAKLFFEIHDPTQVDRQGPDIGDQYRSAVFYKSDEQKQITENLIHQLKEKGYKVATEVVPATKFWRGEEYHQGYYTKKNGMPYCHSYTKRF